MPVKYLINAVMTGWHEDIISISTCLNQTINNSGVIPIGVNIVDLI